jgi:hypothetical protein
VKEQHVLCVLCGFEHDIEDTDPVPAPVRSSRRICIDCWDTAQNAVQLLEVCAVCQRLSVDDDEVTDSVWRDITALAAADREHPAHRRDGSEPSSALCTGHHDRAAVDMM